MQDINEEPIPRQIESIIGSNYIFEIRLDKFNFHYQLQRYTVTKIFDIPIGDDVEQPTKVKKGKEKTREKFEELDAMSAPAKKKRTEI